MMTQDNSRKHVAIISLLVAVFLGGAVFAVVNFLNEAEEVSQQIQSDAEYSDPRGTVYSGNIITNEEDRTSVTVPEGWKAINRGSTIFMIPEAEEFVVFPGVGIREGDSNYTPTIQIDSYVWEDGVAIPSNKALGEVLKEDVILGDSLRASRVDFSSSNQIYTRSITNRKETSIGLNYKTDDQKYSYIDALEFIEGSLVIE